MKAIAFSWVKSVAKRQENDKNDFHIRKANFRMSEIFDFLHFICTRLDAPKAGPPAVANFARKKIFHIKGRLRMESFMFRGQGVPELHVRTD